MMDVDNKSKNAEPKKTQYVARTPDQDGVIHYSDEEHQTWKILIERQLEAIPPVACQPFLHGLKTLDLPRDRIPQLDEVTARLDPTTGWGAATVPALIPFKRFCELLANRKFPCATFIRTREELDYLQEPDIFHEVFGHCAMLTNPEFADFTATYGKLGLEVNDRQRRCLQRLYWFTVEFGLVQTDQGMKIYGGGILSSIGETQYALGSEPEHRPFDLVDVLRTPYRIDIMQPIYYVLEDLSQLEKVIHSDILSAIEKADTLGMFAPTYPPKNAETATQAHQEQQYANG